MWTIVLCADWSKEAKKREVYCAWPAERRVAWLPPTATWTMASVLAEARRHAVGSGGAALVGFDAPIGVPRSYWDVLVMRARRAAESPLMSFVDWLAGPKTAEFYTLIHRPEDWRPEQPFYHVPERKGGKRDFEARMAEFGVQPLRHVDRPSRANSLFIAAGIPGSVGSATIDIWRGLEGVLARRDPTVTVWPFEGSLGTLAQPGCAVVAEIYPRIGYGIAHAPGLGGCTRAMSVAKTGRGVRESFLDDVLAGGGWVRSLNVTVEDVEQARASEDAFDALVTALALLRLVLEGRDIGGGRFEDPVAEGGILGAAAVDLESSGATYTEHGSAPPGRARFGSRMPSQQLTLTVAAGEPRPSPGRERHPETGVPHACPIPGCAHVFHDSRGGWDAHVATHGRHPGWHPETSDPEERKRLFRVEFPEFFR